MERTQIYLGTKQKEQLEQLAERDQTTVSALVRAAIDSFLVENLTPDLRPEDHPVWSIVGIVTGEDIPEDGAEEHDRYIYGDKA